MHNSFEVHGDSRGKSSFSVIVEVDKGEGLVITVKETDSTGSHVHEAMCTSLTEVALTNLNMVETVGGMTNQMKMVDQNPSH